MVEQSSPEAYFNRSNTGVVTYQQPQTLAYQQPQTTARLYDEYYDPDRYFKYVVIGAVAIVAIVALVYLSKRK